MLISCLDILNSDIGINYKAKGTNDLINKASVQAKVQSAYALLKEAEKLIEKEYKE